MPLIVNGVTVKAVNVNGSPIKAMNVNGVEVWKSSNPWVAYPNYDSANAPATQCALYRSNYHTTSDHIAGQGGHTSDEVCIQSVETRCSAWTVDGHVLTGTKFLPTQGCKYVVFNTKIGRSDVGDANAKITMVGLKQDGSQVAIINGSYGYTFDVDYTVDVSQYIGISLYLYTVQYGDETVNGLWINTYINKLEFKD